MRQELNNLRFHSDYDGKNVCRVIERSGVPYLSFTPFETYPFIIQGFSTRYGGVSEGDLSSMNLSYNRGDKEENVDENYRRISKALGVGTEQLVFSDQVHDTKVAYVDGTIRKYKETDGLITDKRGSILVTSYADCVPLYFVDPQKKVIGLSHSGWRGTVGKIGAITVKRMMEEFGSKPADLVAVVGPSICKDCYEVSRDVYDAFRKVFRSEQLEDIIWQTGEEKYHLNLWNANQIILKEAGLKEENIHISGLCTCCNSQVLFSHRKTQGKRGNLNGFLGLC